MQNIPLYRYLRPDGGVTVSLTKPDTECTNLHRLVADEGMILTDGANLTPCTDTDTPDIWTETPNTENQDD